MIKEWQSVHDEALQAWKAFEAISQPFVMRTTVDFGVCRREVQCMRQFPNPSSRPVQCPLEAGQRHYGISEMVKFVIFQTAHTVNRVILHSKV
jgi:hypothetical protein